MVKIKFKNSTNIKKYFKEDILFVKKIITFVKTDGIETTLSVPDFSSKKIALSVLFFSLLYFTSFFFIKKTNLDSSEINFIYYSITPLIYIFLTRKDFSKFSTSKLSWKNVLKKSGLLMMAQTVMIFPIILLFYCFQTDLQNTRNLSISIEYFSVQVLDCVLIGITEELFKMCTFLALITLLPFKKKTNMISSTVVIAMFFGLSHCAFWGFSCVIPIFVSSIPDFLFFSYFKDLRVPIVTHVIHDIIAYSTIVNNYPLLPIVFIIPLIIFLYFSVYSYLNKIIDSKNI